MVILTFEMVKAEIKVLMGLVPSEAQRPDLPPPLLGRWVAIFLGLPPSMHTCLCVQISFPTVKQMSLQAGVMAREMKAFAVAA